jgi:uncharacterized SAM-binding protein YcdF (DUF218 family)
MLLFKKIVAHFFFPLSICLEILFLGLLFLWFSRRQKTGKIIVSLGTVLLFLVGCGTVSDMLLGSLESKYPPVADVSALTSVKWIVVLGGGISSDTKLPLTDHLTAESLVRLVEGVRLHRKLSNNKLLLSGGNTSGSVSEASVMAEMAIALGMKKKELVLESESKDTKDQARFIQSIIGSNRFILVTSASHMARSMALFQTKGMNPIPAPIGHTVKKKQKVSFGLCFPSAKAIDKMERVFYEYMGMTWAMLRGQISQ